MPRFPGNEYCISSNEAFHLEKLPKKILIEGGGYIAVEFANIFHGLGVDTTLVYRGAEILSALRPWTCGGCLHEAWRRRASASSARPSREGREAAGWQLESHLSDETTRVADQVMLAVGRMPNTEGLGLEAAGVELDKTGRDHRRRIFAHQCPQHLGDWRRDQPHPADAGRHPRGDVFRRDRFPGQPDQAGPRQWSRRRCSRSRRSARSA